MLIAVGLAFGLVLIKAEALGCALIVALLVAFAIDAMQDFPLLVVLGASLLAALLLRAHVVTIALVAFAAFDASVLVVPDRGPTTITVTEGPDVERDDSLPLWIHVVLDEHIGIEGIPAGIEGAGDLAETLRAFYRDHGFRLFDAAYSHYTGSVNSLSNLVNLARVPVSGALVDGSGNLHTVRESRYFDHLAQLGYRINVYQSSWMDFCHGARAPVQRCVTYPHNAIGALADTSLPAGDRARIILAWFAAQSSFYLYLREAYRRAYDAFPASLAWKPPRWDWNGDAIVGETAMHALDRVRADLDTARRGEAYFLHLLLPHNPYVYDSDCVLQGELSRRLDIENPTTDDVHPNSPESRALRYAYYLEQVRCTTTQLGRLLDVLRERGLYEDAIVIVHGDHGSRITTMLPYVAYRDRLSTESLRDLYSTLFAAKAPGIAPGNDACPRPLEELLASVVTQRIPGGCDPAAPFVYLVSSDSRALERHPARFFSRDAPPGRRSAGGARP